MAHLSSYNIWIPNQQVTYNHRSSIFHQKHFNQNPPKLGQKEREEEICRNADEDSHCVQNDLETKSEKGQEGRSRP